MVTRFIYDRFLAFFTALSVLIVMFSTEVGLSLWFLSGVYAETFGFLYVIGLTYIVVKPQSIEAHRIVGGLGTLFWLSRAIAFIELIYDSRLTGPVRWDLLGAVSERFLLVLLVAVIWHLRSLERIAFADIINDDLLGINGQHTDS